MNTLLPVAHAEETTQTTEVATSGGIGAGLHAIGLDGRLLAAQIVNFIILFFILKKFLYQPLVNLMEKRREQIEASLKKAEEIEKRAAEFEVEHQKRLNESKAEATALIEQAKKAAESIRQETLATTQTEADKMLAKTHTEITQQKETMLAELKHEIGGLVVAATAKVIGQKLDAKTDMELIEQAIREVQQ